MADWEKLASSFLEKHQQKEKPSALEVRPINSFQTIFAVETLKPEDRRALHELFSNDGSKERQKDFSKICRLTQECRSIQKQAVVLIGERIYEAKQIFHKYSDQLTSFTKWLDMTFSSRKTAYNALAFYELYHSLDIQLQTKLKQMPMKASYILASRKGDIKEKKKLIENYQGEKQKEILLKIQDAFPLSSKDKRTNVSIDVYIEQLEHLVDKLESSKNTLNKSHKQTLKALTKKLSTYI